MSGGGIDGNILFTSEVHKTAEPDLCSDQGAFSHSRSNFGGLVKESLLS